MCLWSRRLDHLHAVPVLCCCKSPLFAGTNNVLGICAEWRERARLYSRRECYQFLLYVFFVGCELLVDPWGNSLVLFEHPDEGDAVVEADGLRCLLNARLGISE